MLDEILYISNVLHIHKYCIKLELILNAHSLVKFLPLDGVRVLQPNIFYSMEFHSTLLYSYYQRL